MAGLAGPGRDIRKPVRRAGRRARRPTQVVADCAGAARTRTSTRALRTREVTLPAGRGGQVVPLLTPKTIRVSAPCTSVAGNMAEGADHPRSIREVTLVKIRNGEINYKLRNIVSLSL